jgi:putative endonuclease
MPPRWHVYLLECADRTLYTGITTDPLRRVAEHNGGARGAKYTRARRPVTLRYAEEHPSRSAAASREAEIKRLSRAEKLALGDVRAEGA